MRQNVENDAGNGCQGRRLDFGPSQRAGVEHTATADRIKGGMSCEATVSVRVEQFHFARNHRLIGFSLLLIFT